MKKILLIIIVLIAFAALVATYLYNKAPESVADKKAVATLSADSLFKAYENDENLANQQYLDKVILVTGKIQSVDEDTSGIAITLQTNSGMFGVICKMENSDKSIADYVMGSNAAMKGVCTGYLMDVVLIGCVEVEDEIRKD